MKYIIDIGEQYQELMMQLLKEIIKTFRQEAED